MTTNKPEVKRYDCASGGAQHCYGCYTMKEGELGDYVEWEAYEALQAECEKLREHLQNLIDQTTPLEPVPGNPMWSRRIQLDEVIAERDQLRVEREGLRKAAGRAQSAFCAVIEHMLGDGRHEAPLDFLHYWSEGEFDLLRCHWPEAPAAIYYADPQADHDEIDAAMQADNPC